MSEGLCWPSASTWMARLYPWRCAYVKPVRMAPPTPRLNGMVITVAPASRAAAPVASVDPSSTTATSYAGLAARISRTV